MKISDKYQISGNSDIQTYRDSFNPPPNPRVRTTHIVYKGLHTWYTVKG